MQLYGYTVGLSSAGFRSFFKLNDDVRQRWANLSSFGCRLHIGGLGPEFSSIDRGWIFIFVHVRRRFGRVWALNGRKVWRVAGQAYTQHLELAELKAILYSSQSLIEKLIFFNLGVKIWNFFKFFCKLKLII